MIDLRRLPQRSGGIILTDAGIETTLTFRDGFDLPHFAAFICCGTNKARKRCVTTIAATRRSRERTERASSWKAPPGGRAPTGATSLAIP
jgi:hypothetical protein